MISRLRGEMVAREPLRAVIEVGGVGYDVAAPERALDAWSGLPEVIVHVSTQVREDAIALFGFESSEDKAMFSALLAVSGVGPRLALAALDRMTAAELATAIAAGDVRALGRISGVGKKTAQRLCLDLKDKLPAVSFRAPAHAGAAPVSAPAPADDPLVLALARLGYTRAEIDAAVRHLAAGPQAEASVQDRLRAALSFLYSR
jgi:Holliday junction DNA helicase RuvA